MSCHVRRRVFHNDGVDGGVRIMLSRARPFGRHSGDSSGGDVRLQHVLIMMLMSVALSSSSSSSSPLPSTSSSSRRSLLSSAAACCPCEQQRWHNKNPLRVQCARHRRRPSVSWHTVARLWHQHPVQDVHRYSMLHAFDCSTVGYKILWPRVFAHSQLQLRCSLFSGWAKSLRSFVVTMVRRNDALYRSFIRSVGRIGRGSLVSSFLRRLGSVRNPSVLTFWF
jgi:hypothetical protein